MHWNSEYKPTPDEIDYAHPDYYKQEAARAARSAQSTTSPEPYADFGRDPLADGYDPTMMREYRGPASMEGYVVDAGAEQREAAARGTSEASKSRRRKGLAGLGGIGATIGALLIKFPLLGVVLKFGWAGISALISIVVYASFLGWPFAVGLVALLFVHEMGHALVMKWKGLPVGGMIFIPMLGAAVMMNQMPKNARDEAEVGIAGPIAGAIASLVCLFLAHLYPETRLWAALAYFGFFMNLFNLIPIVPFDGGRVLAAIDRRIWIVGFIGLLAFQVWTWINGNSSWFLLLFIIMAGTQLWARHTTSGTPEMQAYYKVPLTTRILLSVFYFGLAALLVLGMTVSHQLLFSVLY